MCVYPPTLPSTCQGRAAPGTTVGVERCFACLSSMTYLSITFRRTLLVSRLYAVAFLMLHVVFASAAQWPNCFPAL